MMAVAGVEVGSSFAAVSLQGCQLSLDETRRLLAGLQAALQVLPLCPLISLCFSH